jgi:RNA polymerase sigma-70 factor (ECF subfamily)
MAPPDDEWDRERELLRRIARRERAAFEAFYRLYERRVHRFVARMVEDDGVADEVTSDVMVAVWRSAPRYGGRAKPSTWVLGIAHHKALDRLRRRKPDFVELKVAEPLPDARGGPDRQLIADSTRDEIDVALATLSPEHRAALHLAFVLELGQAEIAAIVGCPLGTVKTRLYHAKRALRRALPPTVRFEREVS